MNRPPVIAIMGHVDHGKTTLLDYVRKTNTAAKEAGGITQSIGAYEIEVRREAEPKSRASETSRGIPRTARDDYAEVRKITFIDTPGHEAFSLMREECARAADLVIIVVAADDGVKPQTKEALACVKKAGVPFVIAINKIDLPGANVEKAKNDLLQNGVLLEGYGGAISWHAISAKTGEGVKELLDLVLLAAEMEDLQYNSEGNARGIVIKSGKDPRRGITTSVIVKDGMLKIGQYIRTKSAQGKIKTLETSLGKEAKKLAPSSPALITGFGAPPKAGDEFIASENETDLVSLGAREKETEPQRSARPINDSPATAVIIKADEAGSLDALKRTIQKIALPESNTRIEIAEEGVGNITENDVKFAIAAKGVIVGFKVKTDPATRALAETREVPLITGNIIYELEKSCREFAEKKMEPSETVLEVLKTFGARKGKQQIVGGKVQTGKVKNRAPFEIKRGETTIGRGKIVNLQSEKKDVSYAEVGREVGVSVETDAEISPGNLLVFKN